MFCYGDCEYFSWNGTAPFYISQSYFIVLFLMLLISFFLFSDIHH